VDRLEPGRRFAEKVTGDDSRTKLGFPGLMDLIGGGDLVHGRCVTLLHRCPFDVMS